MAVGVVLKQLGAVDGADAQLPLHRRDERRALEQGPGQRLQGARHLRRARTEKYVSKEMDLGMNNM